MNHFVWEFDKSYVTSIILHFSVMIVKLSILVSINDVSFNTIAKNLS